MRTLIVDFWSDGNIGDAVMQREIISQASKYSTDIHIVSCFGANQFQLNAFNESLDFDNTTWHPSFFQTFINLDRFSGKVRFSRVRRLINTFLSLVISNCKLSLYKLFKCDFLLSDFRYLKNIEFDVIIFNGRNYRDFNSALKNYINNQPLLIHQKLIAEIFPTVPKINAGFSAWEMPSELTKVISTLWKDYTLNVARESFTFGFISSNTSLVNLKSYKDLSFDYLAHLTTKHTEKRRKVAFSLTNVANIQNYMKGINEILGNYVKSGFEIILVDQVYLEHEQVENLVGLIDVPFDRVSSKKIGTLLKTYAECEFVVSTRMHGSIMALSQGCKVASLAYDNGAKWLIIKDEIPSYPVFKPDSVQSSDVINYLSSPEAGKHTEKFISNIEATNEKYIEKFLCNINTKS